MAGLMDTLNTLRAFKIALPGQTAGRVRETAFSPNPGGLRMMAHVPPGLGRGAPLVVALHGCTQTAAGYDTGTGWSALADRAGFAVLCPEQVRANNQNVCFNWFEPGDIVRGQGEVASMAAMVNRMIADFGIDRRRVFVTGLSAGGAMTSALLACYPETFAAGAIIAGLPFGAADTVQSAMQAMHRGTAVSSFVAGKRVRAASAHQGPWPRVSVWHGTADHTVRPSNADELIAQWSEVHGLTGPGRAEPLEGSVRQIWTDSSGRVVLERVIVAGLGHGVPIVPGTGIGIPGPHIIASSVSSTEHIARFFGVLPADYKMAAASPVPTAGPESALARVLQLTRLPRM